MLGSIKREGIGKRNRGYRRKKVRVQEKEREDIGERKKGYTKRKGGYRRKKERV